MTNKPEVRLRRVYDKPTGEDGTRVLVDRGLAAGAAQGQGPHRRVVQAGRPVHRAAQMVRPRPARFAEFTRRYRAEFKDPERAEALARLRG